jgi:hypothetical protein
VRRLDVEEKRGDHGHNLLARDGAVLVRALDKLVDLLEVRQAAQLLPGVVELPRQAVGVPTHAPGRLHRFLRRLARRGVHLAEKLVLDLIANVLRELAAAVDAERRGQGRAQGLEERVPLRIRHDILRLVVLLERLVLLLERLVRPVRRRFRGLLVPHVVARFLEVALQHAVIALALVSATATAHGASEGKRTDGERRTRPDVRDRGYARGARRECAFGKFPREKGVPPPPAAVSPRKASPLAHEPAQRATAVKNLRVFQVFP